MTATTKLPQVLRQRQSEILSDWVRQQMHAATNGNVTRESEVEEQSRAFLAAVCDAIGTGTDINGPAWASAREFLKELSQKRARQGFTPTQTATFIFSLKQPVFSRVQEEFVRDPAEAASEIWTFSVLIDRLGLFTFDIYQQAREQIVTLQQQELIELSTPVVKLWDGILALPLIGTLDSGRAQVVMESLLQQIVQSGASIAIIDITGVPTVDTLVAQHLLKTIAAARLMGADCIISGVRPQIAQTIVHLGVELGDVSTKATLADAFRLALRRSGQNVIKDEAR